MTMGVFGVQMSRRWKVLVSIGRGDKRQWGFSVLLCSCLKSNGICYTERITTMGRLRIPHVVFAVFDYGVSMFLSRAFACSRLRLRIEIASPI